MKDGPSFDWPFQKAIPDDDMPDSTALKMVFPLGTNVAILVPKEVPANLAAIQD